MYSFGTHSARHESANIYNTVQSAAQIGYTKKPATCIWNRLGSGPRENFPRLCQGKQVFRVGRFNSQPGRGYT